MQGTQLVAYLDLLSTIPELWNYRHEMWNRARPRPGMTALVVGSGLGDDARRLANAVWPGGRVDAMEPDAIVREESQQRGGRVLGTLHHLDGALPILDFEDATYDLIWIDRVLHLLPSWDEALSELFRVLRPGGLILAAEPDWSMLTLTGPQNERTRYVLDGVRRLVRQNVQGRHLAPRFGELGLVDVVSTGHAASFTDPTLASGALRLPALVGEAVTQAGIDPEIARVWLDELVQSRGNFGATLMGFVASGRRRSHP